MSLVHIMKEILFIAKLANIVTTIALNQMLSYMYLQRIQNMTLPYRAHSLGCTPLHSLTKMGNLGFSFLMLT